MNAIAPVLPSIKPIGVNP